MCAYGWGGSDCQQGMYNTKENVIIGCVLMDGVEGIANKVCTTHGKMQLIMGCVPMDGMEAIANKVCTSHVRMQ